MRNRVAAFGLSAALLLAAAPAPAEARVLSIYPHQLKDWATSPGLSYSWGEFLGSAASAQFMYPLRLPVGARVTRLRAWVFDTNGTGSGSVHLIRVRDGAFYEESTDDLASVSLPDGVDSQWDLVADAADGPAPARVAAGYRYFLFVTVNSLSLGTIKVDYTAP